MWPGGMGFGEYGISGWKGIEGDTRAWLLEFVVGIGVGVGAFFVWLEEVISIIIGGCWYWNMNISHCNYPNENHFLSSSIS